ncbi:MAG: arsenate reductase [Alphaproteobacteria bacterium]|nr:arsenate reductase [Alphaproteobacteria bacterium]MBU0793950.1 arsenate reductase [Alphaproteobacteria bacterium]MBU0877596.1 arsenate reductase [Alphaproteobacteria bacterium]MBU1770017.1 arsenate reductase [Alphaproteobacteria bacterium]
MTIVLHGTPNCDTVKKARKWLDDHGVAYDFRDYKKTPPTRDELSGWSANLGWEVLLNRAGTTFRKLPEDAKTDLDEGKALSLMVEHPSMIKRPVVTGGGDTLVGFKPEQWAAAFSR